MKVTKYGIIFAIAIIPIIIITWVNTRFDLVSRRNEIYYNRIINTAVEDAASLLTIKQEHNTIDIKDKNMCGYKDKALETFFRTLYINFNIINNDLYRINTVKSYIPAIIFIDYDGYLIYSAAKFTNDKGEKEFKQTWYPKKGYVLEDEIGNIISFTLDDYIYIYKRNGSRYKLIEGRFEDLKSESDVLNTLNKKQFETIKKSCIVSHIEKDLEYFVNKHNDYAKQNGVIYNFNFTAVDKDNWDRAIDDIGFVAFIQGIPVGVDKRYNSFAIGGSNILQKQKIIGFVDKNNNRKYYIRESEYDNTNTVFEIQNIFDSMDEAAKNGYSPY